jgi:Tfp pilus assembly protein PilV
MPVRQPTDRGASLVEAMIAILVAFVAMAGIGTAVFRASITNKNQGTEQARLTVLAQEKMEELLRLSYGQVTTNTTLITNSGWAVGLSAGGGTAKLPGTDPTTECAAAGAQGYVDFLDKNGIPLGATNSPIGTTCVDAMTNTNANGTGAPYTYQRRWQITDLWGNPLPTTLATGDGSKYTFSGTISRVPIEPKAVVVTAASASGTDDGLGNISGPGIASGTIDYSTGAITVKFAGPPGSGVSVNVLTTTKAGLKQVTVVAYSQAAVSGAGALPSVALTSLKSQ